MNLNNKHILEAIGVIAVVFSLLFVAYEIQQANRIAIATTEIEIRNAYAGVNELVISDPVLSDIFVKMRNAPETLTESDCIKLGAWTNRMANIYTSIEAAYENGLASEETYNVMFDDIRNELSYDVIRPIWRQNLEIWSSGSSSEVSMFIANVLDEYPPMDFGCTR